MSLVSRLAVKAARSAVKKAEQGAAQRAERAVVKAATPAPRSLAVPKPKPQVKALPAPPKQLALPKPFTVPVVPADTSTSRVLPTLNVSDKGGLMEAYEPYTEMVPVSWLENLEGNELRYGGEKLKALSDDIATRGFRNPLIVSVGKESGSAILGEGNHRLAAAKLAGLTHVPVRVAVGDEIGGTFAGRSDLVPLAGKYFPSQAKPSSVFTSLQEGADPSLSYMKLREQPPMDPELQALLDEFNAQTVLESLGTKWPDEGHWSLPDDFGADVPIVTTGPAIIQRQKPVTTWHGTPHVFAAERKVITPSGEETFITGAPDVLPDVPSDFSVLKDYPLGRFRSERLGSGEGAQQYGIGTYLAENPEVARNYRSELTQDADPASIGGVPLEAFYSQLQRRADMADPDRAEAMYDRLSALEDLGLHGDIRGVLDRAQEGAYLPGTTKWFQKEIVPKYRAPGALYQVDLDVDPREFLDYDAPLAGQTEAVRRAVLNMDLPDIEKGRRSHVKLGWFLANQEKPHDLATGRDLIAALPHSRDYEHTAAGSQYLLGQGIPGVRYWDEGSREARRGTRNFVVFDPERDLTIKERFNNGGLAVKRTTAQ